MPTSSLSLRFSLRASPERVRSFLTDPDAFISVHPIIDRMVSDSAGGYHVYETIPVGPFHWSFRYRAEMAEDPTDGSIRIRATVRRFTRIDMQFRIEPGDSTDLSRVGPDHAAGPDGGCVTDGRGGTDGGGCVVTEEIVFNSPLPIGFVMRRVFRRQHDQLFRNMDRVTSLTSASSASPTREAKKDSGR